MTVETILAAMLGGLIAGLLLSAGTIRRVIHELRVHGRDGTRNSHRDCGPPCDNLRDDVSSGPPPVA